MFEKFVGSVAHYCARHALIMIALFFGLSLVGSAYTFSHLKMDTDTGNLVAPNQAWRKAQAEYYRAFPQFKDMLVVVVDATTPDMAKEAVYLLQDEANHRPDLFDDVRLADAGPFFDQYGLLFLPTEQLQTIVNATIKAQPFLASLAGDPSLRGLFSTLDLALTGIQQKASSKDVILTPLKAIDETVRRTLSGDKTPLSWQSMILNSPPDPRSLRHLLLMRPHQDFTRLQPAKVGMDFIRSRVKDLDLAQYGVTVRLTGDVALEAEEFSSVAQGTGVALVFSIILVLGLLFLALRSWRAITATFTTLIVGLIFTLVFAACTIGSLNLISIAFAVMFIGLSIDFGIQFGVRFYQEGHGQAAGIFNRTGQAMARPLTLAAFAIAVGFLSFLPTDYRGVSELGLIAGAGMLITLILNLTLLPALLSLFRCDKTSLEMGYRWAAPLDRFLINYRPFILVAWLLCTVVGAIQLLHLRFDLNPLHLKDQQSESVAALKDLAQDKLHSPYPIVVLADNLQQARSLQEKLTQVPEVAITLTADSFVPKEQKQKIAILQDAQALLEPSLTLTQPSSSPSADELRSAIEAIRKKLAAALPSEPIAESLAQSLGDTLKKDDTFLIGLDKQILRGFLPQLAGLEAALNVQPVNEQTLPAEIRRDWIVDDGRALLLVFPSGDADNAAELEAFIKAVRQIAPNATGPAIQIYESAHAVVVAFQIATGTAIFVIAILLFALLRRVKDVLFVIAPLGVAAAVTALIASLAHVTLNFANVIALPLLLGIGVAFNIYFVVNWRRGIAEPLQTPTARATLFSALTTASSFASLALSAHKGTASMGLLLLIGLTVILATSLFFLPVLMGKPSPSELTRHASIRPL